MLSDSRDENISKISYGKDKDNVGLFTIDKWIKINGWINEYM